MLVLDSIYWTHHHQAKAEFLIGWSELNSLPKFKYLNCGNIVTQCPKRTADRSSGPATWIALSKNIPLGVFFLKRNNFIYLKQEFVNQNWRSVSLRSFVLTEILSPIKGSATFNTPFDSISDSNPIGSTKSHLTV